MNIMQPENKESIQKKGFRNFHIIIELDLLISWKVMIASSLSNQLIAIAVISITLISHALLFVNAKRFILNHKIHISLYVITISALKFSIFNQATAEIIVSAIFSFILEVSLLAWHFAGYKKLTKVESKSLKIIAEYLSITSLITYSLKLLGKSNTNIEIVKAAAEKIEFYFTPIAVFMLIIAITLKIYLAIDELNSEISSELKSKHNKIVNKLCKILPNYNLDFVSMGIMPRTKPKEIEMDLIEPVESNTLAYMATVREIIKRSPALQMALKQEARPDVTEKPITAILELSDVSHLKKPLRHSFLRL